MRSSCSLFVLVSLALMGSGTAARADSWDLPRPRVVSSKDGRWYVIIQDREQPFRTEFLLVRRRKGTAPRPEPDLPDHWWREAQPQTAENGDEVVARGACQMPMRIHCLDKGRGFLLFERYGALGHGTVLELRDGKGKVNWTRTLDDWFTPEEIQAFLHTTSSIHWYEGMWVDESAGEVVIVYWDRPAPRVLVVSLKDGTHRPGTARHLLGRLGQGSEDEQIVALQAAEKGRVDGLLSVVRTAFSKESTPLIARLHMALYLHRNGDRRGVSLVTQATRVGNSVRERDYALRHLAALVGAAALPHLKSALGTEDADVRLAVVFGFELLGEQAVDPLLSVLLDDKASVAARNHAVSALWQLGARAARAVGPLDRIAKQGPSKLAARAKGAAEAIRKELR